jgi:MFS family permease
MINSEIQKHVRHNSAVNILDGAFFGLGMGFASTVTVVPLFINELTDSTVLIGLIPSIQMAGWHLPQILTASRVAGLRRYLPMVLWMTAHERWPFLGLGVVALGAIFLDPALTLFLAFLMLCIHALGGGFTATAWQTMIGKIMPLNFRGTFWGLQSAAASIMIAVGGYTAGVLLLELDYPYNFALCFFIAGIAMIVSWGFLAWTREPENETPPPNPESARVSWGKFATILREDSNLRAFLLARFLSQFGQMAIAFFTIYGVRQFQMNEATAGAMLAVMTIAQTISSPSLGWLGDRLGHRRVFAGGALALGGSAAVAMVAPTVEWLFLAFALAGVGHTALWTIAMTMTLEFGTDGDRPYYVGLVNTLIAPATLTAPLIGGVLADSLGFGATFGFAAVASVLTAGILFFVVQEPRVRIKEKLAAAGERQMEA